MMRVRLSKAEYRTLREEAKQAGLSVSELARERLVRP
jgi:hypothetical protein